MAHCSSELKQAIGHYRGAFVAVAGISAILNVLILAGSIYMMMVYDSILPSHSVPTLFGLLAMVIVAYAFQGYFEALRSRILGDMGAALDRRVSDRVQDAMRRSNLRSAHAGGDPLTPMRDLDAVRSFLAGPGPANAIDLPWIGFFLVVLFALHPWLGAAASTGALVMVALTWATHRASHDATREIAQIASHRYRAADAYVRHAELASAMGMQHRLTRRWQQLNRRYLTANDTLARRVAVLAGTSKVFRMFLQSALLTVGALLVIDGEASGGIIFASSIIAGRALAPIDQAIANWRTFSHARTAWGRLDELLAAFPLIERPAVALSLPAKRLTVEDLWVAPPGAERMSVTGVTFALEAGDVLGIIGPSAAGKSSLVRALVGAWEPRRGKIDLDGAAREQWDPERLGSAIGYLPQAVELLPGTVAENIARFDPNAPSDRIVAAATAAGVHDLIVGLADGYATVIGEDGVSLSAGQSQRIALARALYDDPFLIVLDEPNSNLDRNGDDALETAIAAQRARGAIVVVIAHRASALTQATHVLSMEEGRVASFGPRQTRYAPATALVSGQSAPFGAPVSFGGRAPAAPVRS